MTLAKREYTAFVIQHDGGYYVRLLSGRYQIAELGDNLTSELDLATVFDDEETVARVVKGDLNKSSYKCVPVKVVTYTETILPGMPIG